MSDESYGSLIIFNPEVADSGMYACEATNVNANPEKRRTPEAFIDIQSKLTVILLLSKPDVSLLIVSVNCISK